MEKMLISVSGPQAAWLRKQAEHLGISVSELVRRLLDEGKRSYDAQERTLAGTRGALLALARDVEAARREEADADARHKAARQEHLAALEANAPDEGLRAREREVERTRAALEHARRSHADLADRLGAYSALVRAQGR